jgi:hypothetical protein
MEQFSPQLEPQPGETGSSATITIEIIIDSYPSLIAERDGSGDPLDAVEDAVDAALSELPALVAGLSERIMSRHPVRMYLVEDDEGEDDEAFYEAGS